MEDITDADYNDAKIVWEDFEIKNLTDIMICMFKVIDYCEHMYLKTFEINALKYMNLALLILAGQVALIKAKVRLELLTDIDMLLMIEKDIRGGMCRAIRRYVEANNKYMKDYDTNKKSSYLKYWAMSPQLPVDGFEWVENTS